MNKSLLIRKFFRQKNIKNYFFIILALLLIITTIKTFKIRYFQVINSNYQKSYIYAYLDNDMKKYMLENKNVKNISKAIREDKIIIVEESSLTDKILISNKLQDEIDGYKSEQVDYLSEEVYLVPSENFSSYEYQSFYYITLDNWLKYAELFDYLSAKDIDGEFHIVKEKEISIENYYQYLEVIIYAIILISFVISFITTTNIAIDFQKSNELYFYLGYSKNQIFFLNIINMCSLLILAIIINELIQALIRFYLNIQNIQNLIIYVIIISIQIIVIILNKIFTSKNSLKI